MSEGGLVTYTKITTEPRETEVVTMRDLLYVLFQTNGSEVVRVQVFDGEGRRHEIAVTYVGESTGVKR